VEGTSLIQVREARKSDAQFLAELNDEFNGIKRASQEIARVLQTSRSSTETVLVAEDSGAVVGFACYQILYSVCYDAPWMEITELYVIPARRRSGAGRALVREAMGRAEQAGVSEVLVRTNVMNEAAKNLYKEIGLEAVPDVVFCRSIEK
jgi:ribosomal protein S18 acetylase RimI-like enzyme